MKKLIYYLLIMLLFVQPLVMSGGNEVQAKSKDGWEQVPEILSQISPPEIPDRDYLITDFGAVGDGVSDARPAIMEAITKAASEGGGRVILPAGEWFSKGPIHFKSNINLHVSEGARLVFSEEPSDYLPVVLTSWEGTQIYNYSPLIYAYQVENVAITGKGIIDGNAENGFATWRPKQGPSQTLSRKMGQEGVPLEDRVFGEGHFLRPSFIQFVETENLLIEDVTLYDSPFWIVHPLYSNNIIIRGLTIESFRLNNDGIDVDSSTNVLIENNYIHTGDDCIVIKSGRDQDGWRLNKPSENIIIRNNTLLGHNALSVGSEMSGGARNIFMEDIDLIDVRAAIYFKSNTDRGGYIEDVWVRNINVGKALNLLEFDSDYKGEGSGLYPSKYRNFNIENVTAKNVDRAFRIVGNETMAIEDVNVKNYTVEKAANPNIIKHIRNLNFDNVWVNGEQLRPYINHVFIRGDVAPGNTIEGLYEYVGGTEENLKFQWFASTSFDGGYQPIGDATSKLYKVQSADKGKFIKFKVIGESGVEVESAPKMVKSLVDISDADQMIQVTADSWVSERDPNSNYGSSSVMSVKNDPRDLPRGRVSYVNFDLTELANHDNIGQVIFHAYGMGLGDSPEELPISIYELADPLAEWYEGTLTWSNRPAIGQLIDTAIVVPGEKKPYQWDITEAIKKALENGNASLSIAIWSEYASIPAYVDLATKESGEVTKPQIAVYYEKAPEPIFNIDASFNMKDLQPNKNLNVQINIQNNSDGDKDVLAVVALYDENNNLVLVGETTKNIKSGKSKSLPVKLELPKDVNYYHVKVFALEGTEWRFSEQIPLSNIVIFN
ncbi:glycosyl hydrolase family 28 protein [Bacillus sp. JJ1521]|uniref:glycosyl hydrolase family 28 protein n=1 Tax=Bacillus sp. JJ1521 TaxID=3122957 RepID=UPI003000F65E